MRISKKQLEEIDFLTKYFCEENIFPDQIQEEYISHTVLGNKLKEGHGKGRSTNPLINAKWNLDIQVKMWREDLSNGITSTKELLESYNFNPFFIKIINGIVTGIKWEEIRPKGSLIIAFCNIPENLREQKEKFLKNNIRQAMLEFLKPYEETFLSL